MIVNVSIYIFKLICLIGSFKIRGASYQFSQFPDLINQNLVTISAGNYGTAFATLAKQIGVAQNAMVFMPKTVPQRRKTRIEVLFIQFIQKVIPYLKFGASKVTFIVILIWS